MGQPLGRSGSRGAMPDAAPAEPKSPRSLSAARRPAIVNGGYADNGRGHGHRCPAFDLQPRQFRPRPSAPLPDDRASSGRNLSSSLGVDLVGLADHRQLRLQVTGRFRAGAGGDQAAQRRLHVACNLHIDIEQTLAMRGSIIQHTAEIFDPHLFLVDKEPLGLRGEVRDTLVMLKERGTRLVLGLRDVMDEPVSLLDEWRRKRRLPRALRTLRRNLGLRSASDLQPLDRAARACCRLATK